MTNDSLFQRLHNIFAEHGQALFLVGGSVRDELLGRTVSDCDFATDARPDVIKRLLNSLRCDAVYAIGEKFGTIGAHIDGTTIEITTYRAETYEAGSRKPEVIFGDSLTADLARRDFTMNAIAMDVQTKILTDPFGGLDDIESKLIRAVGDPLERFAEDPLRLLRAVRFATVLEFQVETRTLNAIPRLAAELQTISRERIADEMNKLLLADRPSYGLRMLVDTGLMAEIIPEVLAMVDMRGAHEQRHKDVYGHVLQVVDSAPVTLDLRWAALLHDIAKPLTFSSTNGDVHFFGHEVLGAQMAKTILTRLKFDRASTERICSLVAMHMRINTYSDWSDGAVRRFMRDAGERLNDLFALSRADITSHRFARVRAVMASVSELEGRVAALEAEAEIAKMHSPLDGNDLMLLFERPPGPWLGRVKTHLLDLVLDGTLDQSDKIAATTYACEFMRDADVESSRSDAL